MSRMPRGACPGVGGALGWGAVAVGATEKFRTAKLSFPRLGQFLSVVQAHAALAPIAVSPRKCRTASWISQVVGRLHCIT